jgi:hypothetical protein
LADVVIVELGARIFGDGTADADGTHWKVTGLEGWGTPNARLSSQPMTSRHGTVPTEQMWSDRTLIVKGIASSLTEAGMDASWDDLHGVAGDLLTPRPLIVRETIPKQIPVVSGGDPRAALIGGLAFAFELPLIGHAPWKTSLTPTVVAFAAGATHTVTPGGNRASIPTVTLTSGGTLNLRNGTRRLSTTTLPSGAVADFGACTLRSGGGADLYSAIFPTSLWWDLARGANTVVNEGTAGLSLSYSDTWT